MSWLKRAILQSMSLALLIALTVGETHTLRVLPTQFAQPTPIQPIQGGSGIGVKVTGSSGSTRSTRSPQDTQIQPIYIPELVTHTANSYAKVCITYTTYTTSNIYDYQMELSYAQTLWSRLLARYQLCTSSSSAPSLSSYLTALWSKIYMHYLSPPTFVIPPGLGVVGVPSYVVTQFPLLQTFSDATPYGELVISASASIELTVTIQSTYDQQRSIGSQTLGPFTSPGYPWPTGGIVIDWSDPGTYTVAATLLWNARWSLDGQSGLFSPVTTSYEVPRFQVESLQALRMTPR